jgi:hypothetical protein
MSLGIIMFLYMNVHIHDKFWLKNLKERDHLEPPDVDGEGNIKMHIKETGYDDMDWLNLI